MVVLGRVEVMARPGVVDDRVEAETVNDQIRTIVQNINTLSSRTCSETCLQHLFHSTLTDSSKGSTEVITCTYEYRFDNHMIGCKH